MTRDFTLNRRWRLIHLSNIVLPLAAAASYCFSDVVWWLRALMVILTLPSSAFAIWSYRTATSGPLVSISDDEIAVRPMAARHVTRLSRAEIKEVMWSSLGNVCLRLRSGQAVALGLQGLRRDQQDAICAQVRSWEAGA